jgi:ribosome-binding protein aMBF1 (putative translation factor)
MSAKLVFKALRAVGWTYTRLAKEMELSVSHVRSVIRGERKSPRVEEYLATILAKQSNNDDSEG